MKIQTNQYGIHGAEQSYRNFDHKVKHDPAVEKNQQNAELSRHEPSSEKVKAQQIKNSQVFSNQELATLKALFGYDTNESFSLYGRNKLQNVNSGMLLDVKG